MVEEAAANAAADATRKEAIEARNSADSMIFDTEKNIDEFKEQLDEEQSAELTEKIAELKEFMGNDEATGEEIRAKAGELQAASLKVFEVAYKKKAEENSDGEASTDEGEFDDKEKKDGEKDIQELKDFMANEDATAEDIRAQAGELQAASLKVFEVAYKKKAEENSDGEASTDEGK